jgi:aspartate kinase
LNLIVQKFGGTSVANVSRIKKVAKKVAATADSGKKVVVVVSALGDTTDRLIKMAHQVSPSPSPRELDMLLSTGEQVSAALLSMALQALGYPAISLNAAQAGIKTDKIHTKARLLEIDTERINRELKKGKIVVITGFQGITEEEDITTLGRGGSDLTAIALAATLKADLCEIYTDVQGVFTADPRLVPQARLLKKISYEEMLEMAATGARVMQTRAVEYARNFKVRILVKSSFNEVGGTLITGEEEIGMEKPIISGVTFDVSEAKLTIREVPDRPGIAAKIFGSLAEAQINVDMIIQNISQAGTTDISFTVERTDLKRAEKVLKKVCQELGAKGIEVDPEIGKVSLVGAGMKTHPGIAARMFKALAEKNINIEMISTSTIKISCVIKVQDVKKAVQALHQEFNLAKEDVREGEEV